MKKTITTLAILGLGAFTGTAIAGAAGLLVAAGAIGRKQSDRWADQEAFDAEMDDMYGDSYDDLWGPDEPEEGCECELCVGPSIMEVQGEPEEPWDPELLDVLETKNDQPEQKIVRWDGEEFAAIGIVYVLQ